jgi:hypothetical protein
VTEQWVPELEGQRPPFESAMQQLCGTARGRLGGLTPLRPLATGRAQPSTPNGADWMGQIRADAREQARR